MRRCSFAIFFLFTTCLYAEPKVVVLSGSLRKDSLNTKLAKEAANIAARKGAQVSFIDLNQYPLPFFSQDIESSTGMPENAKYIRKTILDSNALIIASPNYNGSMSGVLKNLLDWMSRTEDGKDARSVLKGKKVALLSASTGKSGGSGGLNSLQRLVEKLNGIVVPTRVSVPAADKQFDQNGQLKNSVLRSTLAKEIDEILY